MFLRSAARAAKDQREQRSNSEQLPGVPVRRIFSFLEFNDIKNSRLVCTQWHRHSLNYFNFILVVRVESNWRNEPIPYAADGMIVTVPRIDDYVYAKLLPYPAIPGEEDASQTALSRAEIAKAPESIYFYDMAAVVNDNIKQKIKHVVVHNAKWRILRVLEALAPVTPAAISVNAIDNDLAWPTRFLRDRQGGNLKCVQLNVSKTTNVDPEKLAAFHLFSSNAGFIRSIYADDWASIARMLNKFERNNDTATLAFDKCEQIFVAWQSCHPAGVATFRSIAAHFSNIAQLRCTIGADDPADDIESLEHLANLRSLTIPASRNGQEHTLPKLCLPNLTDLCLGSNILLPEDAHNYFLPELKTLELDAVLRNAMRLDSIAVPVLANLTALTTRNTPADIVRPFMRSILPVATKLQTLVVANDKFPISKGRLVVTSIYDTLVAISSGLAHLTIGTFQIPDSRGPPNAFPCRQLVEKMVKSIRRRNLKTAITIVLRDNPKGAMKRALGQVGVGGVGVLASAIRDVDNDGDRSYELTWYNNAAGIQQKLKIQVKRYLHNIWWPREQQALPLSNI